jgi:hypothetical protein
MTSSQSATQQDSWAVIIAGSRAFERLSETSRIHIVDAAITASGFRVGEVVSGTARGVDQAGEQWAAIKDIPVTQFPAQWDVHGRAAGPIRNKEMATYADALIAISINDSAGTASMIDLGQDLLGDDRVFIIELIE